MESGSCAEDEHDWQRCPSAVYPESSASATAVPATGKEMESGPKKQGGAAPTPGERENKRDRYLNGVWYVCVKRPQKVLKTLKKPRLISHKISN